MKLNKQRMIAFAKASIAYGIVAFVALSLVSLRTCGMSPDSAAMCDLMAIHVTAVLVLGGYSVLAFLFFRSKASGPR
jgi:hypothetical protein